MYRLHIQGRKIRERALAGGCRLLMDFSTLKMVAVRFSETSICTRFTRRCNPETAFSKGSMSFWKYIKYVVIVLMEDQYLALRVSAMSYYYYTHQLR
jgi:hypothetical protein